ncbi:MAG TPA: FAD-binding oxidoreductase [Woeseiaceae bacterium]|nr:FAD-binding oxidoreductase [Woeseiaceae bacterium]
MDRRRFCKTTLAASIAATYPLIGGCSKEAPVASKADTSIAAVSLDGAQIELKKAAINELGEALRGTVLLSGDPGYDSARKVWNGMHDKRPALIARVASAEDVSTAVQFAHGNNLLLAVRGGGHSWPGKSVCDRGLMIDLSALTKVSVDSGQKRAVAGGGALLNGLDTACLEQGLVTTAGVVSHTGIGGFTLGGGYGRLNRKYGLAVDNLLGATIVTADGEVRHVSAEEEADLFWAIRGGGGNFGVVTDFEFQLHPFNRNVLSGMIVWPLAQANDVLGFYADWHQDISDDLYVGPALVTLPDGTGVVAAEVVYAGDPVAGEKELAAFRAVGKPIEDGISMQDYMVMQTQEDATFAHGIRSYAKNGMVQEFTHDFATALIDAYINDPRIMCFTHTGGGAVNRVTESATAFPHRNAQTMIGFAGGWTDPAADEEAIASVRQWFSAAEPFIGGYYDNIEFDRSKSTGNYGPAYERLARIKGQYDPDNLFRLNSNIKPA